MNTKPIKLSSKQYKVIQKMRGGDELYLWYGQASFKRQWIIAGEVVLASTIKSLEQKGLIMYDQKRRDTLRTYYVLTGKGRELIID